MSDEQLDCFGWLADHTGCGTIRIKQPMTELQNRGWRAAFSERLEKNPKGGLPKVLVGQRVCKDAPSQLWFMTGVMKERPKMIYEVDDDLWNIDPSNWNAYQWFVQNTDVSGAVHDVQNNIRRNIAVADLVTVTTEPLADLVRNFNPNVVIIPNYIPRWVSEQERPETDGPLTIGWGGSGSHNMDWDAEGYQIKRFLTRNPDIRCKIIGGGNAKSLGLPEKSVDVTGWISSVDEFWRSINFDIGVIPLKHHVFNQSKSAIKFLENASLGIPTVASNAGPYAREIQHGITGFLVKRDHEWGKYLRDLVNDEAMRQEIGANAKAWAKTQILEDHMDEYEKVYFE